MLRLQRAEELKYVAEEEYSLLVDSLEGDQSVLKRNKHYFCFAFKLQLLQKK